MKISLSVISTCLFALITSFAMPSENLLVNASFEADAVGGKIPGWQQSPGLLQQSVWIEEETVFNGDQSLGIRLIDGTVDEGFSSLSQRVELETDSRYVFSLWFKRDSFVHGTYAYVTLFDKNGKSLRVYRQNLRTTSWANVQTAFNSGEAHFAEVRVPTTNDSPHRRITVGRTLWLDDASLVKVDGDSHRTEIPVDAALQGSAIFSSSAAGRLYPWFKLNASGPHTVHLAVGETSQKFRAYSYGESLWLQPILPDLVISEGELPVKIAVDGEPVEIENIVFSRDATWRPEGARDFLPAAAVDGKIARPFSGEDLPESIQLHVSGDLPDGEWPVTQGVPFPAGALQSVDALSLVDSQTGEPVAMQADPLMRWPDGSLRWVALSIFAGGGDHFNLDYQGSGKTADTADTEQKIDFKRDSAGTYLSTGPINVTFPQDGSHLIGAVRKNGKVVLSHGDLVVNGEWTTAGSAPTIEIEERGPLRAVVKLSGQHRNKAGEALLDYVMRLTFYAGRSRIDVANTFYHRQEPVEINLDSVDLLWELQGSGADTAQLSDVLDDSTVGLSGAAVDVQSVTTTPDGKVTYPFYVKKSGETVAAGQRYDGHFGISGPDVAISGWIQDFWQNSPRSLGFSQNQLRIGLLGEPGTPFYMGMSKTTRLTLSIGAVDDAVAAYKAEPLLLADADWYALTGATDHRFGAREEGEFAAYENSMALAIQRWIDKTDQSLFTKAGAGLLHAGDTMSGKKVGNNLETARDEGSLVQFLRTGDREYYDHARLIIDHFLDIDIDHSEANRGLIWIHGEHKRTEVDAGRAGVNGHSWFNGVVHFNMFEADRRINKIADDVGHYYSMHGFDLEPYVRPWRTLAWQLMDLVQAYQVTGKPDYLDAARESMKVTRHQRDFLIEEWTYMYSVGMKGVRMYYMATGDPEARELYLQLMDGFLRLRERPTDTVNGEWLKPEGTVLGNFPIDRSAMFYNEAAWAYWLSGDRSYVDRVASDLNWHTAFEASDPTLMSGSADLVRAMRELGVEGQSIVAELPWVTMPTEQLPLSGEGEPQAGVIQFVVSQQEDSAFELTLFKGTRYKYMVPYEGSALLTAPDGTVVSEIPVSNKGINIYKLSAPADGQTGRYTVTIKFDNIWFWTHDESPIELDAGSNEIEITSRYGVLGFDALAVARVGDFPWIEEDQEQLFVADTGSSELPESWTRFEHPGAGGGTYIRRTGRDEAVTMTVEVPEAGEYRLYARVWRPMHGALDASTEDMEEPLLLHQIHDMSGSRVEPIWSLAIESGKAEILRYWDKETQYSTYSPLYLFSESGRNGRR